MNRLTLTALSALMFGACSAEVVEPADGRDIDQHAIYGGSFATDAHHTSVVAISSSFKPKNNIFCSGTLIAPDVVLTAAHCLDEANFFAANFDEYEPGDIEVGFGFSKKTLSFQNVADVEIIPSYDRSGLGIDDLGLIRLTNDAPSGYDVIEALPFSLALDPVGDVGETVDFAGFGSNDLAGVRFGSKLNVDGEIDAVLATTVEYDQNAGGPCGGDSGGPMFIDRSGTMYVAGVTSWGSGNCDGFGAFGVSMTPDVFEAWIAAF